MNKSELLAINQRWAGDRLAGFVKAVLKECSCSMALIAAKYLVGPGVRTKEISRALICIS